MNDPASDKVFLFMEYISGGSLLSDDDVKPGRIYSINVVLLAARDVLLGLDYLHKMRIVHGDIKPSNMLVSGTGDVKISDFGVSNMGEVQVCIREEARVLKRSIVAGVPCL